MHQDNRMLIIEPQDVGVAIEAILLVLAKHVRSDPILQRQIAVALEPVVTLRVAGTDQQSRRPQWFDRGL